jgi:hypothetical protein
MKESQVKRKEHQYVPRADSVSLETCVYVDLHCFDSSHASCSSSAAGSLLKMPGSFARDQFWPKLNKMPVLFGFSDKKTHTEIFSIY